MSLPVKFIVFIGIVSLFADITYEGARGIIGPYLSLLGASGAAVGLIVGIGELIGYLLRGAAGYFTDKTKQYWPLTFLGYVINLVAVPLLALTHHWIGAAVLIVLERFGKAIRVPPRDAMLSFAAHQTGRGWGFGLHQALDRIGAVIGPLFMALILFSHESYRIGFVALAAPALFSLGALALAKRSFPNPENLEVKKPTLQPEGLSSPFFLYLTGVGFASLGFTSFAIIAYHWSKTPFLNPARIPLFYGIANAIASLGSLIMGKIFDRQGISFLGWITAVCSLFAPLVFYGNTLIVSLGMVLWGIGSGSQTSLMRAAAAHFTPPERRGSAYGLLNLIFGVAGAAGSALMGFFYDVSILTLVIFSMAAQLVSVPIFFRLIKSY